MAMQSLWSDLRGMRNIGSFVAFFALTVTAAPVLAQQDEPKPQERVSQPGETQTGPRKVKPASTAVMKKEQKPVPTPIGGKTVRMEDALKTPTKVGEGKRQPKVDASASDNPQAGTGEQKPRPGAEPKPTGSHLQLVIRVSSSGTAEVVSAKEVPGLALSADTAIGQWVYAVFAGDKALTARGIADPFEMRSFAPPEGSPLEGQGHHIVRAQTALIPVAVPGFTLKSPDLEKLSIQLYRVKPGAPVFHVDPSVFQKLQQEQRLEIQMRVPAATLGRQIRLKAASPLKPQ